MKYLITILLFFCAFGLSKAQDSVSAPIRVIGMVVENNSVIPIPTVSVGNLTRSKGIITNFDGEFAIAGYVGDTIRFSYVGYKSVDYIIKPLSENEPEKRLLIGMVRDTVLLQETTIYPWPKTYSDLRASFVSLSEKSAKEKIGPMAGFREVDTKPKEPKPSVLNPISFIFSKVGKKARQERKMKKYREVVQDDAYFEE